MKEEAAGRTQSSMVMETVDTYGEETEETRTWYEKVGQKAVREADGTEQVKVGVKRVRDGSHKERVYDHWWNHIFPKYELVDDYKDVNIYETRIKYKTVMRDEFKEHNDVVKKFRADVAELSAGLIRQLDVTLDDGIEKAVEYAKVQAEDMKVQFTAMFDELDRLIQEKYDELEQAAADEQSRQTVLEKNREILNWIETCQKQVNEAIDF